MGGQYADEAVWIVFILMVILIVTAVSNSANLTDGLDGLTSGSSAVIGVALGVLAYVSGRVDFASYLNIMYIPVAMSLWCMLLPLWVRAWGSYGIMHTRHRSLWATREV